MIVTCERCATQFQLDDTRVPKDGVRVRCSRCKHAFHVEPPGRGGELDQIQRVARRALEEAEEGPDVARDLDASSATDSNSQASPSEEEESDWEFNEGLPSETEPGPGTPQAAEEAVDALLSGSGGGGAAPAAAPEAGGDAEELFELAVSSGGSIGESPDEPSMDAGGEIDFGRDEPQEPLLEAPSPPPAAGADSAPEAEPGGVGPASAIGARSEAGPSGVGPASAAGARSEAEPSDASELGSPAEWDIFDEAAEAAPAVADPAPWAEGSRAGPAPAAFGEDDTGGLWLRRAGAALGWTATLALCGVGLLLGLAPRPPGAASAAPREVGGLQLHGVAARWLDNAVHGPLYVVSGRLRNPQSSTATSGPLALVLRDASGRRVGDPVALGPPLAPRLLREADREALRSARARAGAPLAPALEPGAEIPFEAVVWPLPEAAERFDFEVVERLAQPRDAPGAAPAAPLPLSESEPSEPGPAGLSSGARPPTPPPGG